MAASFVQLPDDSANTGKKLQTWDNTLTTDDVYTEATTPTSSAGVELATSAHPFRVDPVGTTVQPVSGTVTANAGTNLNTSALALESGGNLATLAGTVSAAKVAISAASLPLPAGASTAAKQPALGTAGSASADVITVQGVASMTALKVDGSAVTQPVSASSLPLPTGAATAAKQPALGTAGSAASDVITIQGVASMTKLLVTPDSVALPLHQSVNVDQLNGTTTDTNSGTKSAGTLRVVLATDQPALTNKLLVTPDANSAINLAQIAATSTLTGNGTAGAGAQRVTVASDNTPFQIAASNETGSIYNGTTALTPLFSTIVASSSGATTIVAAVTSKKIRVVAMQLVANAAVNVKWQSHVTPTDKTGLAYLAANGGYVLPYCPVGWFETIAGEALDINLSGAVAVGGSLTYVTI